MDAREYRDFLSDEGAIKRLSRWDGDECIGRGNAIVIDDDHQVAVMVEDCGFPNKTGIPRGAIVRFLEHPEAEPKIIGEPAFAGVFELDGRKYQ